MILNSLELLTENPSTLVVEVQIEDSLNNIVKGYNKLSPMQQAKIKAPYLQTSLLIEELINLEHDIVNGLVKVKERSGMRKDRYSALQYSYYIAQELSRDIKPKKDTSVDYSQVFKVRVPQRVTRFS